MSTSYRLPTYRDSFNEAVERSIARRQIDSDLYRTCRATGEDYYEVVAHIWGEIAANEAAQA